MSALEPNTAGQPLKMKHFVSMRRLPALISLGLGSMFGLNGLWTYFQWQTWPTHVSLRRQRLGMDWLHYSAIILGCISLALLIYAAILFITARRRAERDYAAAVSLPSASGDAPSLSEYVERMDRKEFGDD